MSDSLGRRASARGVTLTSHLRVALRAAYRRKLRCLACQAVIESTYPKVLDECGCVCARVCVWPSDPRPTFRHVWVNCCRPAHCLLLQLAVLQERVGRVAARLATGPTVDRTSSSVFTLPCARHLDPTRAGPATCGRRGLGSQGLNFTMQIKVMCVRFGLVGDF